MESLTWRKSSYSGGNGGGCVEVAETVTTTAVRDSRNPNGGMIVVTPSAFRSFILAIKADELNK